MEDRLSVRNPQCPGWFSRGIHCFSQGRVPELDIPALALADLRPNSSVYELGCGFGRLLKDVHGVRPDISVGCVNRREPNRGGCTPMQTTIDYITFNMGTFDKLPLRDRSVDLIFSNALDKVMGIQGLPQTFGIERKLDMSPLLAALAEIWRVLAPGGTALLIFGNQSIALAQQELIYHLPSPGPLRAFFAHKSQTLSEYRHEMTGGQCIKAMGFFVVLSRSPHARWTNLIMQASRNFTSDRKLDSTYWRVLSRACGAELKNRKWWQLMPHPTAA